MVFVSTAMEWIVPVVSLILLAGLWFNRQRMARLQADLTALRQRRGLLEDLLSAAPIALWARGPDGSVLYRNRLALDLIEDSESAEGDRSEKIDRELHARALAGGGKQATDLTLVAEGQTRLYALTVILRPGGGAGTMHYASDMSALEALQADLAQHVAAQSEVLENLRTAIAIFGADRRLKFFNSAYADLWRLDKAWLADEPGLGEVLEAQRERRRLPEYADFPAFKREQLGLFQSLDQTREDMMHLPDGTTLRVLTSLHPMGGLMIAAEDVTDTLALERNYNTLIAVQRETLDNLAEGVALFGSDHRLKLHNAAFARLWELDSGWAENHPVIAQWFDRLRRFFTSEAAWQAERRELLGNVDARRPHHLHLLRQDGRQLAVSLAPLPDGASFVSSQDITDREQAAQALAERNRALEAADRLKTEFVANMSYELRTPLNTIIGFADIMANGHTDGLSPRQMEYARGILESSQRLLELINDILDLARVDAGHLHLEAEEVDVHALLAGALGLIRERARNQKLHILFDCPPAIGKAVMDLRRMRQILFHLLTNACKFTPPGGQVRLHATGDAERIVIAVSDTGIGIPAADRLRVFERFERGAGSSRLVGAGLGLSLVRSFVELHGGHIELQSVEGEGASVICVLPRTATPLASTGVAG